MRQILYQQLSNYPTIRPHSYSLSAIEQISASMFQLVKNINREVKRYLIMRCPPTYHPETVHHCAMLLPAMVFLVRDPVAIIVQPVKPFGSVSLSD